LWPAGAGPRQIFGELERPLCAHLKSAHGCLLVPAHQPAAVGAYLALFEIDDYLDLPRMEAVPLERAALDLAHQPLEADYQLRGLHSGNLVRLIGRRGASLQSHALLFRILYNPKGPEG
jgi:hypothetical protein